MKGNGKREEEIERPLLKNPSENPRRCYGLYLPLPLAPVIENRLFSRILISLTRVLAGSGLDDCCCQNNNRNMHSSVYFYTSS